MKKFICLLIVISAIFGCKTSDEEEKQKELILLSVDASGCYGQKSAAIESEGEKIIVSSVSDSIFKLEHINATFNCCLPNGIEVDVFLSNDTIYYFDSEKTPGNCKCLCSYNTVAEVGRITPGEYVLCLISGESVKGSVILDFKENMYEEITVSELIDN